MSGVQRLAVEADEADQRLDRWFRRRFPDVSHGRLEKMLRKGEIRVDGGRAKASDRVQAGQMIRVPPLPTGDAPARASAARPTVSDEDGAMLRGAVLHRDDAVLVLNKPPGLAVQGGSGVTRHLDGMLDALIFDADERPRLTHRLDKDTSGVIVLGRTRSAAMALARAFHSRDAVKTYWAATSGAPKPRRGVIRYGLVKAERGDGERMRCVAPDAVKSVDGAKPARTEYAVVDALGDRAAWVALRPITGRTHQLRAHMAEIGCPIVGDGKYAPREEGARPAHLGGAVSRKLHLHARAIRAPHPSGGVLVASAPLPEHMARTWAGFGWAEADADEALFEDAPSAAR